MAIHVLDELTWRKNRDCYSVEERVFSPYRADHRIQTEPVDNLVLEEEEEGGLDRLDDQTDPVRNLVLVGELVSLLEEVDILDHCHEAVVET